MHRAVRLSSVIICEGGNDVWDRGQKEELIDGKWVEDLLKICYLGPEYSAKCSILECCCRKDMHEIKSYKRISDSYQ